MFSLYSRIFRNVTIQIWILLSDKFAVHKGQLSEPGLVSESAGGN